ncbi:unnamed protein product [Onchocerca flexuosa]|uniref:Uncharacterized protein n=1 Tax=Onchocerca flexuosa TaxID=387005 RepID=A0A183I6X3_9BILA|nr:unnamed protein product [Onchocerca flexuosa]
MFPYKSSILLMFTISNLSTAQFISPFGGFGAFAAPPGLLNPFFGPVGGLGMAMGFNPMLMSTMGMNMFTNPNSYLPSFPNPYASLAFTNNGNSLGYGTQKYGASTYSRRQFMPAYGGCMNRYGCGYGFQKKQ